MLSLYRRHVQACPHRSRRSRRCRCPLWVQGTLAGERIRKAVDLTSWEAGTELVRGWEAAGAIGFVQETPSVGEAVAAFLHDAEARNLRHETLRKYRYILGKLRDFCSGKGLTPISRIGISELRDFRASWKDGALSQSKHIERLRAFFRFCEDSQWSLKNPAKKLSRPQVSSSPTLPLSQDETAALRGACERYEDAYGRKGGVVAQRLAVLVELLLHTGLRIQDGVCLPKSALQGTRLRLYTAKTGVAVSIPLPDTLVKSLQALPSASADFWFWTGNGTKASVTGHYHRRLHKLFILAGIVEGHSHRLRATFAVRLLEQGIGIGEVATLLGNTVRVAEKHYAPWVHTRQLALDSAVRKTWT